jgi:D-alanyl-D-alanine carboxypeptidase
MNRLCMRTTRSACRSALALAVVLAAALLAAAAPSSAARQQPSLRQETQALVRAGIPGAVVLTSEPGHATRIAAGIDLAAARRPMLVGDRFRVGSITKTFVAALVLRLAEDDRLSLDDSVERWLPGLVPNGETISVRQLLQHTSGLFDYAADPATFEPFATNPGYAWQPRDLVAIAVGHEPSFAPGRGWGYSNTNYVLLGLIVEAATGNAVGTELERRIFRPLHLWATTFDTDGRFGDRSSGGRIARFAHGYSTIDSKTFDASDLSPSWAYAAGAISSTAGDLATFYGALVRGKVIDRRSLQAMTAAVPLGRTAAYGLGLQRAKTSCGWFWGHDGGTFGYTSNAFVSADGRRVAIVFVNRGPLSAAQRAMFNRLAARAACERGS